MTQVPKQALDQARKKIRELRAKLAARIPFFRRVRKLIDQDAIGQQKQYLDEGTATANVVLKLKADFESEERNE